MELFVTFIQCVPIDSGFCCRRKSIEGTSHERTRLVFARVMLKEGTGVDCRVQIPPPLTTATNLWSSAEEATEDQSALGESLNVQEAPELVETRIGPPLPDVFAPTAATSLVPSAEEATKHRPPGPNSEATVQVAPEFVEMETKNELPPGARAL
jgi:hypothetical protein